MPRLNNLKNKTILITGANRGIGKAYVEEFLKAGARKIYVGTRDLDAVADMVASHPEKLVPLLLDVTNGDHVRAAADKATDVEVLVNNAGVASFGPLSSADIIKNARVEMEVNYFAPLALSHVFAPILKQNGGGLIVIVSSIAAHVAFPDLGTYCASKAAVHSLLKSIRMEYAQQGTRVLGVYPGPVDTSMAENIDAPKETPQMIALRTISAIEEGVQDLFPDDVSLSLYKDITSSPKAVEEQMQDMYDSAA